MFYSFRTVSQDDDRTLPESLLIPHFFVQIFKKIEKYQSSYGAVQNIASAEKSLFERALIKAISQKGANMYQSFKITKVVPQSGPEYNGRQYVICDFRYELLTGAGFEVDRRGVAAITSEGPAVEVLWAASTRERYVFVLQVVHFSTRKLISALLATLFGFKFFSMSQ